MSNFEEAGKLRVVLSREESKLVRQKNAIGATEGLIKLLKQQIAALEK